MDLSDAIGAMRYLSGMTTGWDDTTLAAYATELGKLDNPDALYTAVRTIAATWTDPRRPPLGKVVEAYNVADEAHRRAAEEARRLDRKAQAQAELIGADRGVVIAWQAYVDACQRQGVEPNRTRFGTWIDRRLRAT